ncbi:MAG: helix-turn-helix domain-containing protein [Candidatus Sericytochromatia bacterium]
MAKLNATFGTHYTLTAMRSKASRLGLGKESPLAWFCLREIAEMMGTSTQGLLNRIHTGSIPAKRMGRRWMISEATLPELKAYYLSVPPWPALTAAEAAKMLGYYRTDVIDQVIQRGNLTAFRQGRIWLVKRSEIERALAYLKQSGETWVPWVRLKTG